MISALLERHFAEAQDRIVVREMEGREYSLAELRADVERIAATLQDVYGDCSGLVFGIAARSSYTWVATMLAIFRVKAVLLPVPIEFSDEQIGSLLHKATAIFAQDAHTAARISAILPGIACLDAASERSAWPAQGAPAGERIEPGICGIIHTSGTTSKPKGVKIRDEAVGLLVTNVLKRVPQAPLDYLSIVPMSLLIEQVLGVFLPILSGGSLTLMPARYAEYGARSGNARDYLDLIAQVDPNFLYLPPKLLEEADALLESTSVTSLFGRRNPHIITGGAKIPATVLESLDKRGVQVYEAYGLSENSSIISLNHPGHRRIGSAGPLLDGIVPTIVDGELRVLTPTLCAGYYNSDDTSCELTDGYLHTGDIAEIVDGYLYITGRKKHVIILSTARNISPEWVETVYKESALIDDIVVFGEGREEPAAIVLSQHDEAAIRGEMARLEPRLADFARVRRVRVVADIERFRKDYYTVTGRPRRQLIERDLAASLY
ncbi:AMP-dependent synthetase [Burkholderia ubonensis]|uniref:AMP-dependent synthetase n=1 Tax=Burkholderia ubonensis TaxID=101571 RepID=A0A103R305_9BURK|nr:AMP-binding protein [Burkholderia ubonensis]AOJ66771.1 AMP-dependent synthetase [Burkholderia ubonensis]KVG60272.1 AMP-dependent synthetase [Burkholderia ubonensis]